MIFGSANTTPIPSPLSSLTPFEDIQNIQDDKKDYTVHSCMICMKISDVQFLYVFIA